MSFHPQPKPRSRVIEREDDKKVQDRADNRMRCEIRELDHWRCRVCGRSVSVGAVLASKRAEVHHIVPRSLAPGRIRDLTNQVTVCGYDHERLRLREIELVDSTGQPATHRDHFHVARGPNFRPGR